MIFDANRCPTAGKHSLTSARQILGGGMGTFGINWAITPCGGAKILSLRMQRFEYILFLQIQELLVFQFMIPNFWVSKFEGVSVIIDSIQDISWDASLNHWALKCIDDANMLLTSLTAFKDINFNQAQGQKRLAEFWVTETALIINLVTKSYLIHFFGGVWRHIPSCYPPSKIFWLPHKP